MASPLAKLTSTVLSLSTLLSSASALQFFNTTMTTSSSAAAATATSNTTAAVSLDPNATDCFVTLPDNALTAEGLATPFLLMPPCSMTVGTQQAFAEAAVFDPATGEISIYHPLILDAGKTASVAPVVPNLPEGASVGLWFGFNGDTLQLLDIDGQDTNSSPALAEMKCVNGEPGITGDIFGQVSWCNTDAFFQPVSASIASGKTTVPPLGTDNNGQDCPSSRSFTVVDQDPSDNLPTQYLLLADGSTIQDTAANRANFPDATVINNASDEALIGDVLDPLIGCTPFKVYSLDDPGTKVSSLATQEIQAGLFQKTPLALVPIGDPDCLLTASGAISTSKTNNYRIGVNQPLLGEANSDNGDTLTFCNNMVEIAPPWLLINEAVFAGQATPDPGVGNNLFTFLCNRYLQSFTNLACTPTLTQTVTCQLDDDGAATSCTIASGAKTSGGANLTSSTASSTVSGATSSRPTTLLTSTLSSSAQSHAGSISSGFTMGLSSTSSLSTQPGMSIYNTMTLSSIGHSISALPTISPIQTSKIVGTFSAPTTGTASVNSATVTVSATPVPVTSSNPHQTFPYGFPRHRHHGGFFGAGFNPASISHATGTTAYVIGTTVSSAVMPVLTSSYSSQDLPVASSPAAPISVASMGPLPEASSTVEAAVAGASPSVSAPAYQSFGPTSFITVTMTVMGGPSVSCAPA